MSDILVIDLSDGNTMTTFITSQEWGVLSDLVSVKMARYHPDKTVTGYALTESSALDALLKAGKDLDADIHVVAKQDVDTDTHDILPRDGQTVGDIGDTDACVIVTK